MIFLCCSKMPKGVGHRYPLPCKLKPSLGLLTTDAIRRSSLIKVKVTSSEKHVLESWSTENVTPGNMLWDDLKFRLCAIRFVRWGRTLMPLAFRKKDSGSASISLKANFKISLGLKKTIDLCRIKSAVTLTMAIPFKNCFRESNLSAIPLLPVEIFSCRRFYAGSAWEVSHG
jgi:hypothetical protein